MKQNFQALDEPLDENEIRRELDALGGALARRAVSLEILEEVASSNDRLLYETDVAAAGHVAGGTFHVCLAEAQTAGRGRRGGKVWHSPGNGSLYLSVMRHDPAAKSGPKSAWLALSVGVEVVSALTDADVGGLGVKWPNDIYYLCNGRQGKLGGVLIETRGARCVVGLGLNVHFRAGDRPASGFESGPAWIALDEIRHEGFDRAYLAALMIAAVMRAFERVTHDPPEVLRARWRRCDLLADREITVLAGDGELSGVARGVDEHGGLRVEHRDVRGNAKENGGENGVRVYYSDEVSVRW